MAIQLIQLDRSLREWGTEAQPTRELLRRIKRQLASAKLATRSDSDLLDRIEESDAPGLAMTVAVYSLQAA